MMGAALTVVVSAMKFYCQQDANHISLSIEESRQVSPVLEAFLSFNQSPHTTFGCGYWFVQNCLALINEKPVKVLHLATGYGMAVAALMAHRLHRHTHEIGFWHDSHMAVMKA